HRQARIGDDFDRSRRAFEKASQNGSMLRMDSDPMHVGGLDPLEARFDQAEQRFRIHAQLAAQYASRDSQREAYQLRLGLTLDLAAMQRELLNRAAELLE